MHSDIRKIARTLPYFSAKHVVFVIIILMILFGMPTLVHGKKKKHPECSVCKDIAKNFEEGVKKTAKSGYGGGNTNWEEKSLGKFATSETRLVEIMEDHICKEGAKECHLMREEYEDHIEAFWFKEFARNKDYNFHQWFCVENIKACCPENTYGPECKLCIGDPKRPCTGNGHCDGEGTREGTGKCKCHSGYMGDRCEDCSDGYFEVVKNDTHTECKVCHISCKGTCWEEGPKGCDECKVGWLHSEEEGCQDVDECQADPNPCAEDKYCVNTQGSYSCFSCNVACVGCTGSGDRSCKECNEGFYKQGDQCKDVDECAADASLCTAEHEQCVNEPRTYSCQCKEGYQRNSDEKCVPKPKDDEEEEEAEEEDVEEKDEQVDEDEQENLPQEKEEL